MNVTPQVGVRQKLQSSRKILVGVPAIGLFCQCPFLILVGLGSYGLLLTVDYVRFRESVKYSRKLQENLTIS